MTEYPGEYQEKQSGEKLTGNDIPEPEILECSICHTSIGITTTTPCDHTFHTHCLSEWKSHGGDTCPLCRCPFVHTIDGIRQQLVQAMDEGRYYLDAGTTLLRILDRQYSDDGQLNEHILGFIVDTVEHATTRVTS